MSRTLFRGRGGGGASAISRDLFLLLAAYLRINLPNPYALLNKVDRFLTPQDSYYRFTPDHKILMPLSQLVFSPVSTPNSNSQRGRSFFLASQNPKNAFTTGARNSHARHNYGDALFFPPLRLILDCYHSSQQSQVFLGRVCPIGPFVCLVSPLKAVRCQLLSV